MNIPTLKRIVPGIKPDTVRAAMGIMVATTYSTSKSVFFSRFKGSATWDKAPSTKYVIVMAWNGGMGGGSGSNHSGVSALGSGGAGGAGANALFFAAPATFFSTSTAITVGAGGLGGVAVSGASQAGNPGGIGGQSIIGNIAIPFSSLGRGGGGILNAPPNDAVGGTSGSNVYVMSNGFAVADGTQLGGNAAHGTGVQGGGAYDLDTVVVGSGTVRIPCSPFMATTGGGGAVGALATGNPGPGGLGGSISFLGNELIDVAIGGPSSNISGSGNNPVGAANGNSYSYVWGQPQIMVSGGAGGGGAGTQFGLPGGNGGVPGGGGGGGAAGATGGGAAASGYGGDGGRGEVWIFEFI